MGIENSKPPILYQNEELLDIDTFYDLYFRLMMGWMNTNKSERKVLAAICKRGREIKNKSIRKEICEELNCSSQHLSGYLKSLRQKKILIPRERGVIEVHPLVYTEHASLQFLFIIDLEKAKLKKINKESHEGKN